MFELLSNGYVEQMVSKLTKPFGIGGIARVEQGDVSGRLVMAQHVRLGSQGVILSRAFHLQATTLKELIKKIDLKHEISLLNLAKDCFEKYPEYKLEKLHYHIPMGKLVSL